jgi:protein SCO1/2
MLRLKIALPFLVTAAILSTGCTDPASKLPNYDKVPAFAMTDSTGHSFSGEELAGKVWIADFIYTTCPFACPRMTAQMHKLEKEVRGMKDVELVSFSVDPRHDTPPVLNDFAHRFGGPTNHWVFLTGTPASVELIADKTFHVGNEVGKIEHSTRFILVDKSGDIRGYYSSSDSDDLSKLLTDVEVLRNARS